MKDKNEIVFPDGFPSVERMLDVLKQTIEKSWHIDLNIEDIANWLNNFNGKIFDTVSEKRLALWLLCNFTYYNELEVNHLCSYLFHKLLHQLLIDNDLATEREAEECIMNCAFTSIGKASESGGMILYHFRQEANLDLERFVFPTEIDNTLQSNIICIDDVMLSGGTASRFFYKHKDVLQDKRTYYITLITTDAAINKLMVLGIKTIYCIKLDERNQAFSPKSLVFYKYPELLNSAKEMANEYGQIIEPDKPLGYRNGQYCFGLYYNTPNNSLPIFWSTNNEWFPIFPRKEKYQNAKQANRKYGYFI